MIFHSYDQPLYFVTFCTMYRKPVLANDCVHLAFRQFAEVGQTQGVGVGGYVIMPEHLHLFVRGHGEFKLGEWIKGLKRTLGRAIEHGLDSRRLWQPGFFDHLVRHDESYEQKWRYVQENPVRRGLVQAVHEWPYQGEVVLLRM